MASRPFGGSDVSNYGTLHGESSGFSRDVPFERLNETVSKSVMTITQNTQTLKSLERQVGTSTDSNNLRRRIQELIKSTMNKVMTSKRELSDLILTAERTGDKRQQLGANSVQQSLNSTTNNFNTVAERVIEKLRDYPQPPRMSISQSGYLDSGELEVQGDKAQLIRASPLPAQSQQQGQMVVSTEAAYLEERAERMEELESDIIQLHEIMGEIGQMVVQQGDQITTIEQHTEQAANNVVSGNTQLDTAVKLKRCSRKLKLVIACVVGTILTAIIITIIVVIVVITKNN